MNTGMKGSCRRRQQRAHARQIGGVVRVAPVRGAPAHRYQPTVTELGQVIRDEVLRLVDQAGQLMHGAIAPGQLVEQPPPQRVARELKEFRRGQVQTRVLKGHVAEVTSIRIDASRAFGGFPYLSSRSSLPSTDVDEVLFDGVEREQLCDLFDELGPDAPTLLDQWMTHDLAAHLALREHDTLAAPGLVVPGAWARFAERRRLVLRKTGFTDLVAMIRSGPPRGYFNIRWVRSFPNLNEFFVHHEDVRRANGLRARVIPPSEDAALFRNVVRSRWFLSRRLRGAGLDLAWKGTDTVISARRGQPAACVRGLPGELLLFLFGRRAAADVEITGSPGAIEAVQRTPFGM